MYILPIISFSLTVNQQKRIYSICEILIYGLCWQCQNPLLSLTDKHDVVNGFNFLKSPSDIENI